MALQLAFNLVFYSDPTCTSHLTGHVGNSTYGVAIESSVTSTQNVLMFPAKCVDGHYNTYVNAEPSYITNLEIPGDLDLIYFTGQYISLKDNSCHFVDNSNYWKPPLDDGGLRNGSFYIKREHNPSFNARCLPVTTPRPHHKIDDHHHDTTTSDDLAIAWITIFILVLISAVTIFFCSMPSETKRPSF